MLRLGTPGTIEVSRSSQTHICSLASHSFRRLLLCYLSLQWEFKAPRSPSAPSWSSVSSVDGERRSWERNGILASVLMRVGVDCSEDVRGTGSDPPKRHHHPQKLRNPTTGGTKRSTCVLSLTASRIASPKTDPHPLGLVDVQGQLDGDEQQGNNKLGEHFCALSATVKIFHGSWCKLTPH